MLDKAKKVVKTIDKVKEMIYDEYSDSGEYVIQGRTLHFEVKSGFYKGNYQYKGTAWDKEAGISVKSEGWESMDGAREHALEDLVAELKKLGHLKG